MTKRKLNVTPEPRKVTNTEFIIFGDGKEIEKFGVKSKAKNRLEELNFHTKRGINFIGIKNFTLKENTTIHWLVKFNKSEQKFDTYEKALESLNKNKRTMYLNTIHFNRSIHDILKIDDFYCVVTFHKHQETIIKKFKTKSLAIKLLNELRRVKYEIPNYEKEK